MLTLTCTDDFRFLDCDLIDLGGGSGLLAPVIGELNQSSSHAFHCTDLDDTLIRTNITYHNFPSSCRSISSSVIDWTQPTLPQIERLLLSGQTLGILASDTIYKIELAQAFAATVDCLLSLQSRHRCEISDSTVHWSGVSHFISSVRGNWLLMTQPQRDRGSLRLWLDSRDWCMHEVIVEDLPQFLDYDRSDQPLRCWIAH